MSSANDYPARGQVKEVKGDSVVFLPAGTNYELLLKIDNGEYTGPINKPVEGIIHVVARKVWTVPSGGNFIQPIFGPPKIIQGRVKWLDERQLVVHAGTNFVVEIPGQNNAIDLANGVIEAGVMVNVTAFAGATFAPRVLAVV